MSSISVRQRNSLLSIPLAFLFIFAATDKVPAQNVEARGLGKRLRDDIPPTQVLRGKLVDANRNAILVESEGKQVPLAVGRDTVVELGAKGSREFLTLKSIVAIAGELQMDLKTVSLRERGWEGIEVCVTGQPPKPQADRGYEVTYTAKAGSTSLPFKFVGVVMNLDPLVVKPLSNYRQPTLAVEVPGQPLKKLPDIKNAEFVIEVPKEEGMIKLNLGERLDLVGTDAQVVANVAFLPNPVATRIYIERSEPINLQHVAESDKTAKGVDKKSAKGTKAATKSSKGSVASPPKPGIK